MLQQADQLVLMAITDCTCFTKTPEVAENQYPDGVMPRFQIEGAAGSKGTFSDIPAQRTASG
jgi:hypothetical protein